MERKKKASELEEGDIIVNKKTGKRFKILGRDKTDSNMILMDDA